MSAESFIDIAVSRKWVEFHFWQDYPFKRVAEVIKCVLIFTHCLRSILLPRANARTLVRKIHCTFLTMTFMENATRSSVDMAAGSKRVKNDVSYLFKSLSSSD